MNIKRILKHSLLSLGLAFAVPAFAQDQPSKWTFDASFYGLAAGMSGDITVRGVSADLDVGFDDIVENLNFGAMGKVRVGYEKWALNVDLIYMDLEASKSGVTAEMEQFVAEPTLSYTICQGFEVLAGTRYNNLSGEIRGPFGLNPSGTQDWWDPIIGANLSYPLGEKFSLNCRGDIGGFGVGSEFTWQAYPYVNWQFNRWGSVQLGYRWVYVDYEDGAGATLFRYDVLTQGPQVGMTVRF